MSNAVDVVTIERFRGIESLTLELSRLTVLLGEAASGKRAVIDALDPRYALVDSDLPGKRRGDRPAFSCARRVEGALEALPEGRGYRFQRLALEPGAMCADNELRFARVLSVDGGNLTNLFASLERREQIAVARALASHVPSIQDVDFRPSAPGQVRLRFFDRWERRLTFAPEEVAESTLIMLALLLLEYQRPLPQLLVIRAPERGLSPRLTRVMMEHLRGLSQRAQIVLVSHAARLLEHVSASEVRHLERRAEDGAVLVTTPPSEAEAWRAWREAYGAGRAAR